MAAIEQGSIKTKVRGFITDTFLIGNDKAKLGDADSFMQLGIIDSTGVLELASYIESEFGLTILDNEMVPENLDSIENIAKYVHRKIS
ncbi:conserved hypothetical protein [Candidatus Zixiibacteriota bacterium]|nr:conserved hypothetical protein [candidate division Zixibacteria bacterium]